MSFDFQKALEGRCVWYEGTPCVISDYDVLNKQFKVLLPEAQVIYCNKNGININLGGKLSTDPPNIKVKRKVSVYFYYTPQRWIVCREFRVPHIENWKFIECRDFEIEVEEPQP